MYQGATLTRWRRISRGPDAITSQLLEEHQRALTSGTDQRQSQGDSTQKRTPTSLEKWIKIRNRVKEKVQKQTNTNEP